jgi:serine/threonine protein kinase
MEKYETIEKRGSGTFADVTKDRNINTGEIVAIKRLKKKYITFQECVELREVKSLDKLKQHENIIKIKEMVWIEQQLNLVFEYMDKNLYELMTDRQNKKFNEGQIRCVMWQTLSGLAHMHKYGFFHRDLKPENLLVDGDKVKLADFGLAREIRSLPPYTDYVSTRWYRAPECILKSTNYNSPVDIWAIGCIMAEMYNLKPLFFGNSEKEVLFRMCGVLGTPTLNNWVEGLSLAKKIDLKFPTSNGIPFSQVLPDASKDALDLISEMLKWDPNKRATAAQLLQHPFFTKYPVPTRISTPDYSSSTNVNRTGIKTVSNKHNIGKINMNQQNPELSYINKKEDDDIAKMLEDTVGFDKCIVNT